MKNTKQEIEKAKKVIESKYDMGCSIIKKIQILSEDECDLSYNSFLLGYLRGFKAGKKK